LRKKEDILKSFTNKEGDKREREKKEERERESLD